MESQEESQPLLAQERNMEQNQFSVKNRRNLALAQAILGFCCISCAVWYSFTQDFENLTYIVPYELGIYFTLNGFIGIASSLKPHNRCLVAGNFLLSIGSIIQSVAGMIYCTILLSLIRRSEKPLIAAFDALCYLESLAAFRVVFMFSFRRGCLCCFCICQCCGANWSCGNALLNEPVEDETTENNRGRTEERSRSRLCRGRMYESVSRSPYSRQPLTTGSDDDSNHSVCSSRPSADGNLDERHAHRKKDDQYQSVKTSTSQSHLPNLQSEDQYMPMNLGKDHAQSQPSHIQGKSRHKPMNYDKEIARPPPSHLQSEDQYMPMNLGKDHAQSQPSHLQSEDPYIPMNHGKDHAQSQLSHLQGHYQNLPVNQPTSQSQVDNKPKHHRDKSHDYENVDRPSSSHI